MLTDQDIRYITGLIRIEIIELQLEINLSQRFPKNDNTNKNLSLIKALEETIERLNHPHKELAPWRDFKGNKIFEGDTIIHPTGETGIVNYHSERKDISDQWTAKYDFGPESRLILQVGDKGRAVVKQWKDQ